MGSLEGKATASALPTMGIAVQSTESEMQSCFQIPSPCPPKYMQQVWKLTPWNGVDWKKIMVFTPPTSPVSSASPTSPTSPLVEKIPGWGLAMGYLSPSSILSKERALEVALEEEKENSKYSTWLEATIKDMELQSENYKAECRGLRQTMAQCVKQYGKLDAEFKEMNTSWQGINDALSDKNRDLQRVVEQKTEENRDLQRVVEQKTEENRELQRVVEQNENAYQSQIRDIIESCDSKSELDELSEKDWPDYMDCSNCGKNVRIWKNKQGRPMYVGTSSFLCKHCRPRKAYLKKNFGN